MKFLYNYLTGFKYPKYQITRPASESRAPVLDHFSRQGRLGYFFFSSSSRPIWLSDPVRSSFS